jgi:hypothetical protein
LAPAGIARRGGEGAAPALAVELEDEVRLLGHLEQPQRHLVDAARGPARERLVADHVPPAQVDHRLEHRAQLVGEEHLLQVAAGLEVALGALDVHAGPGLLDEAGDEPLRHHQRVVEREGEADRDPPQRPEVGAGQARELAVEVALHALRRGPEVGDAQGPLPALRGEEHEEGVPAAVVEADDVLVADLVPLQLEDQLARHRHHLLERGRAVLVLDLGEGGGVDEQEPEAALVDEDPAQVLHPLAVRERGLGGGVARGRRGQGRRP